MMVFFHDSVPVAGNVAFRVPMCPHASNDVLSMKLPPLGIAIEVQGFRYGCLHTNFIGLLRGGFQGEGVP